MTPVRASLEAAVVSYRQRDTALNIWRDGRATMNDDKRIATSAYRKQTQALQHQRGMVRETWSLPATHESPMSGKHFLVDNIIEGLAS
jgi:hypothetical protein